MSIYKSAQAWGVDYRDEWGQRKRRIVGSQEAAAAVNAHLSQTSAQARSALRNLAVGEAFSLTDARDVYLAHIAGAPKTRQFIRERLNRLIQRLGQNHVSQITPRLLDEFIAVRATELSPATLAHEAGVIKRCFRWLRENSYIVATPAEHLDSRTPRRSSGHALSQPEQETILDAVTPRLHLRLLLGLDAGLRISECLALRRNHIDLTEQLLTVWSPKTRSTRTIALTDRLYKELAAMCEGLMPDALLSSYGGEQVRQGKDAVKKIRIRTGVSFRFHDLRHTFATRLAASGAAYHVIRDLLGHSPQTTTDLYLHSGIEERREAVRAMEKADRPQMSEKGDEHP